MKKSKVDIAFEVLGIIFGLSASVFILMQIIAEWGLQESSLSLPFMLGFWLTYVFWTAYGIKFKRIAMSLTNAVAVLLQLLLIIVVVTK